MSGYRRFIAYVYEYLNGKKSGNCGFIKVEVRDQQCRMEIHLHCPGLAGEISCKVYGFARKDGLMNGILLGTCETEKETIEFLLETDASNLNDSGISLGKIGGMVLLTDSGNFFATEWDDQPVRPDNFVEMKPADDASQAHGIPRQEISADQDSISKPSVAKQSTDDALESEVSIEPVLSVQPENPVSAVIPSSSAVPQESTVSTESTIPTGAAVSAESAFPAEPAISTESAASGPEVSSTPARPDNNNSTADSSSLEEFTPFTDGEFTVTWKIHPKDLCRISKRCNALRNNRFIQYGHYNFGHLLLGQRNDGQYILGIPGGYSQQERFNGQHVWISIFQGKQLHRTSRCPGWLLVYFSQCPEFPLTGCFPAKLCKILPVPPCCNCQTQA